MNNPILKSEKDCVGCLACLAVCPKDAILLKDCDFGAKIPYINEEKCIGCKKCERVCHYSIETRKITKKALKKHLTFNCKCGIISLPRGKTPMRYIIIIRRIIS